MAKGQLLERGWPQRGGASIYPLVLGPQILRGCWRVDGYFREKAYNKRRTQSPEEHKVKAQTS